MPQTQIQANIADQAAADAIVSKGEGVAGVKFVNVNVESNTVVVTHDDSFDEATFKSATGI